MEGKDVDRSDFHDAAANQEFWPAGTSRELSFGYDLGQRTT